MSFLHGIEHVNVASDSTPVNDVVTAVIGLVGTAGDGELDKLILCKNAKDDAQFGKLGTIPDALKAIRKQDSKRGSALVFVVCVGGTDGVTSAEIIGSVSATGLRTGLQLFETAQGKYGFGPMIYIAPTYSAMAAVKQELIAITNKTEAMAYIDMPDGMTFNAAIQSRGTTGEFSMLTAGQKILFPQFKIADPDNDGEYLTVPMSAYMAGLRAKVDLEEGWHVSSSNHAVTGVEGMDVDLTFGIGDSSCEANLLNAAGITTAVNLYGNGIVEWGNYSAAYPGSTDVDAFECVRRTRAIMQRAIDLASVKYMDKPFIQANVDAIRNTVNLYYNGLVSQGKIVYGKCFFRPESNSAAELALGHVTFDSDFTPAIPMQRMTFTYKVDLTKLTTIQ